MTSSVRAKMMEVEKEKKIAHSTKGRVKRQ